MESIAQLIRDADWFMRRRDLLALGFSDIQIRNALERRTIFRVRHGWYSVPDAPERAIEAVRVGGRLTSVSALESYDFPVPRRPHLHIAVIRTACRLRSRTDRRTRIAPVDRVHLHWIDRRSPQQSRWRVSLDDALLAVLVSEPRDIAVACASAVIRRGALTADRLAAVFDRAPKHCRGWLDLVSALDDSHGETFVRLWLRDVGIACTQQVKVARVGRLDFRVGKRTYLEVDGAQHDPGWTGTTESSWETDHDRDTAITIGGGTTLRFTYRQLYLHWPRVLAAIRRALADDAVLSAHRAKHPFHEAPSRLRARPQLALQKRRTSVRNSP